MANKGFNVLEFRSVIDNNGGLKSANKFLVEFMEPKALKGELNINSGGRSDRLSFYCKATSLPGIGILTSDVYRHGYGPIERKPYGTIFNDVMLMFYVDGKGVINDWFYKWLLSIVNFRSDKGMLSTLSLGTRNAAYTYNYKEDYAIDVRITTFNQEGSVGRTIVLQEAYPNYMGDIMLDWDAKNQVMILPISLTFKDWYDDKPLSTEGIPRVDISSITFGEDNMPEPLDGSEEWMTK